MTTSFLISTPGAVQLSHGGPVLGDAGQFLIKDIVRCLDLRTTDGVG